MEGDAVSQNGHQRNHSNFTTLCSHRIYNDTLQLWLAQFMSLLRVSTTEQYHELVGKVPLETPLLPQPTSPSYNQCMFNILLIIAILLSFFN